MRTDFFPEPRLEFGGGGFHIDARFGLLEHGPVDRDTNPAPSDLKVAIVGTEETVHGIRAWFDRAKSGIEAKTSTRPHLFPAFPGFSKEKCFGAEVITHDRWCEAIPKREIAGLLDVTDKSDLVSEAVELFLSAAHSVLDQGGPLVLICVPPSDLLASLDVQHSSSITLAEKELDEGGDETTGTRGSSSPPFHDLLKAQGMRLAVPIQMIRPDTYRHTKRRRSQLSPQTQVPLQDEATRAWNLHVALYYKAGGIPWRLPRDPSALTSCFIGISFYRSSDRKRLLSSVAQVFNERGEGIIVRGGVAHLDKDDRQPHLLEEDIYVLLRDALEVYRREHKTLPARLVVHKTSAYTENELRGVLSAANEVGVGVIDVVGIRRSLIRLFRKGTYPPLRGTYLELDDTRAIIYLRGSVDFFRTYPGLYVPRPLEIELAEGDTALENMGREVLRLSKLNWNNTQFDGGEPMTLRAARKVGDILKWMPAHDGPQPSFRFFM